MLKYIQILLNDKCKHLSNVCAFFCVRQIVLKFQKKILLVPSFLCRSCGLLSNQPDPRTQPRSMDPDHMANRVPNRLCHLSLLNKKQTRLEAGPLS